VRFPIRFDRWYAGLSSVLLLPPRDAYVDVGDEIVVRMGWAFRASFPRAFVVRASLHPGTVISPGVHGLSGRWLVNGSSGGLVSLELAPEQRGRVMGVPVKLRELMVSVEQPEVLLDYLNA
jgi:hypothetical protein